jgi:hypothetical protein
LKEETVGKINEASLFLLTLTFVSLFDERFEDLFVGFEDTVGPSEVFVALFDASVEIISRALVDFNIDSKSAKFAFSNVAIISVVALPMLINAEDFVSKG